jgi:CHAT domain-containing protein
MAGHQYPGQSASRHTAPVGSSLVLICVIAILCQGDFPASRAPGAPPGVSFRGARLAYRLASTTPSSSGSSLPERGVRQLFQDRPDLAVETLLRATTGAGAAADPRVLNDLGVAYLARSREPGRQYDGILAFDAIEHALSTGESVEARFNRALILERLGLVATSQRAWEDYLSRDAESDWAREARAHLRALAAPRGDASLRAEFDSAIGRCDDHAVAEIARRSPHTARLAVQDEVLAAWAHAATDGRRDAAATLLRGLRQVGDIVRERHQDLLIAETVAAIEQAAADPERWQALVEGHRLYHKGRRLYDETLWRPAARVLSEASRSLAFGRSPFRFVAALDQAQALYFAGDTLDSLAAFARLEREVDPRVHPNLAAQVRRSLGLIEYIEGRLDRSLELYRSAEALLEATGDLRWLSHVRMLIGESLTALGLGSEAWPFRIEALSMAVQAGAARQQANISGDMVRALVQEGRNPLAALVRDEAVDAARATADPYTVAAALLSRGEQKRRQGDEAGADLDFRLCRKEVLRLPEPDDRGRLLGEITVAEAAGLAEKDPQRALPLLEEASRHFQRLKQGQHEAEIQDIRARAWLALGRLDLAERFLTRAVEVLEQRDRSLSREGSRISHADVTGRILERMVELQAVRLHDPQRALLFVDRGRARILFEALQARGSSRPDQGGASSGTQVIEDLGPRTAMIIYAVLPERLLIWVLRSSGVVMRETPLSADRAAALVTAFRGSLEQKAAVAEIQEAAAALYDVLVSPIDGLLHGIHTLVVVPHRSLGEIPVSALRNRSTGRYLIEDFRIAMVPSASVWLSCAARERQLDRRPPRSALVVGNPKFDRRLFPGLAPLPQAEAEARQVADLYPQARLLLGSEATAERFLSSAPDYEVIHFAGHALSNPTDPARSMLILASAVDGAPGGSTIVYPAGLSSGRLRHARTVFLSACRTASGRLYEAEGVLSIARSFLIAGTPAVIATTSVLEDGPAREFAVEVHRRLAAGDDVATAVRGVQVDWIADVSRGPSSISTWAAFTVVGAAGTGRRTGQTKP